MISKNIVVTIDGPAGAGKSTVAKMVANRLGINYLDTGALYRAVAYMMDLQGVPPIEDERLKKALRVLSVTLDDGRVMVDGKDLSGLIRSSHVSSIASLYSALPAVRERLIDLQREQVLGGGLVADGRDMGTVVFLLAPLKIYLTASPEVRARRRWNELHLKDSEITFDEVLEEIKERDRLDSNRECSPLKIASDGKFLDTSDMAIEEVVDAIVAMAGEARCV